MTEEPKRTRSLRLRPSRAPDAVAAAVVDGPSQPPPVSGVRVVVGRARGADLVVDDPTVSEFHFELRPHPEGVLVQDLGSRNGTYLGDARIESVVLSAPTDLQVGQSVIRVMAAEGPAPAALERTRFGAMAGTSPATRSLFDALARVATTDLSVLLEGPTGSGKELAARGLHGESARADRPFQILDCAAIPSTLAPSVLFGHEVGAFTGASQRRVGVFEAAEGGTVFLDEIGDLPIEIQPQLLRVLEQRQVTRVGGRVPISVDFRVVAASWRSLRQLVNEGRFRDDLYHRLAQVRVDLPSLRERPEDISFLVLRFLRKLPKDMKVARRISREAMAELERRHYPGNVRELRNVVERAAQMAEHSTIETSDLAFDRILDRGRVAAPTLTRHVGDHTLVDDFKAAKQTAIDDFERLYLMRLRERADGSLRKATIIAGVQRHYLRELFRKHAIPVLERAERQREPIDR